MNKVYIAAVVAAVAIAYAPDAQATQAPTAFCQHGPVLAACPVGVQSNTNAVVVQQRPAPPRQAVQAVAAGASGGNSSAGQRLTANQSVANTNQSGSQSVAYRNGGNSSSSVAYKGGGSFSSSSSSSSSVASGQSGGSVAYSSSR